jgi:hypothetical protein
MLATRTSRRPLKATCATLLGTFGLALLVGGCFADKGTDLANCYMESLKIYAPRDALDRELQFAVGEYTKTCMRAKGYDLDGGCLASPLLRMSSVDCYTRRHWWSALF